MGFWGYLLTSVGLAGVCLWLFLQILADNKVADFLRHPWLGTSLGLTGVAFQVFSARNQIVLMVAEHGNQAMVPFFLLNLVLTIPVGLAGFSCWGHRIGELFCYSGAKSMTPTPVFDQALAAESRGELELAEKIYLESFKTSRKRGVAEADMGELRLAYGNLLKRFGRREEAADQWEKAAESRLLPERAQLAAIRTADLLVAIGKTARAKQVLAAAIERHPKEASTAALRERLARLP